MDYRKVGEKSKEFVQNQKNERDKQGLEKKIKEKILTLFIGIIDDIEKELGFLWGHGKARITSIEQQYLPIWKELRKKILDRGNDQNRIVADIINEYVVQKILNKYEFGVRKWK